MLEQRRQVRAPQATALFPSPKATTMRACRQGLIIVVGLLLAAASMAEPPPPTQDAPHMELAKLRSDKRFDALVDATAPAFDMPRRTGKTPARPEP